MLGTLKPRDGKDVEVAIQEAINGSRTIEIVGRGSKRALGRAAQADWTLDMSGNAGMTLYEPNELVLSAHAGTPLAEIEARLAAEHQELAFEPMDYGVLLGRGAGEATLGGVLMVNAAGPRRIKAGAARDHFLGFTAVSGRGETFKSGARVVKNVTGYDLPKLIAGSWGTLAVLLDVTVKVLPRAETQETLVLSGLDDAKAGAVMREALKSSAEVSGAAHLPADIAADAGGLPAGAATLLRLEGVPPSIAHRRALLQTLLKDTGEMSVLPAEASVPLWRAVRDVAPFAPRPGAPTCVWRISTAPTEGPALGEALRRTIGGRVLYDWCGGLVWCECEERDNAHAVPLRALVAQHGGHATLIRAPAAIRASVEVFEPQDAVLAALTSRLKTSFDPHRVLNVGRMYSGV